MIVSMLYHRVRYNYAEPSLSKFRGFSCVCRPCCFSRQGYSSDIGSLETGNVNLDFLRLEQIFHQCTTSCINLAFLIFLICHLAKARFEGIHEQIRKVFMFWKASFEAKLSSSWGPSRGLLHNFIVNY